MSETCLCNLVLLDTICPLVSLTSPSVSHYSQILLVRLNFSLLWKVDGPRGSVPDLAYPLRPIGTDDIAVCIKPWAIHTVQVT